MKRIHVEASTFCNARCPLCPRSLYGYKIEGVYPELHLQPKKFKLLLQQFPNREWVYFNGNLGDPMMNPDIVELALMAECRTSITTNGSIGAKSTWLELAKKNVSVTFSIDGLEDTNHLYRQDVEWNKIMQRIGWYIDAGGKAVWKFIEFQHNKHQKDIAKQISTQLGFQKFIVEDHGRNYGPVLNKDGKVTHWILPADGSLSPGSYDVKAGIQRYKTTHENFVVNKTYKINCQHETMQEVYIDAQGRIAPCCYQGFDLPGRPFQNLENFNKLKETWSTDKCNWVCASSYGLK